ncbi:hypothetical protein C8U37_108110 [Trichococcus patagoniensis]|uniref:Uncharacterized protein n=1 Tax=Trichococcus patagoniensis TaxID=382641 RepID=A0A2T5IL39_9LACT|nr:hypothetical protein C8U37_108110 [Trichococcus patagoniensis]
MVFESFGLNNGSSHITGLSYKPEIQIGLSALNERDKIPPESQISLIKHHSCQSKYSKSLSLTSSRNSKSDAVGFSISSNVR